MGAEMLLPGGDWYDGETGGGSSLSRGGCSVLIGAKAVTLFKRKLLGEGWLEWNGCMP